MSITATQIQWETFDGITDGVFEDVDGSEYKITISAPIRARAGMQVASTERTWSLCDERNVTIATAESYGLRATKAAALAALNEETEALNGYTLRSVNNDARVVCFAIYDPSGDCIGHIRQNITTGAWKAKGTVRDFGTSAKAIDYMVHNFG